MSVDPEAVSIARLVDLEAAGHDRAALERGIAAIFRATAARWPEDAGAAAQFQALWLGQYLENERDLVFLATSAAADRELLVAGYIVGCRIDPARSQRFAALSYFRDFAALTADYPAHLHVNLDAHDRGRRIGERLVETLAAHLAAEGIHGLHVVTGRAQRNVGFYTRLGFRELARAPSGTGEVLFMGRAIGNRE